MLCSFFLRPFARLDRLGVPDPCGSNTVEQAPHHHLGRPCRHRGPCWWPHGDARQVRRPAQRVAYSSHCGLDADQRASDCGSDSDPQIILGDAGRLLCGDPVMPAPDAGAR
jgi:hypothetical protein